MRGRKYNRKANRKYSNKINVFLYGAVGVRRNNNKNLYVSHRI